MFAEKMDRHCDLNVQYLFFTTSCQAFLSAVLIKD